MVSISNEHYQGSQPRNTGATPDATQRIRISSDASPRRHPQERKRSAGNARQKERTLIIILVVSAVLLMVAIGIALSFILDKPEDDGKIFNRVYAAGVDLSGMTPEEAKQALHDATDATYTRLNMTIHVLDETVILSPADTGVRLDVDAVVQAAYNYGRTDSSSGQNLLLSSYYIPVTQYLNLNTEYIQQILTGLGNKYSTTLTQPKITVTGQRPSLEQEVYDTSVVHQTLSVYMGTAEYGLNTKDLYDQIMDAYNSNLFEVAAKCSKLEPQAINVDSLYAQYCSAPKDAQIDNSFSTTPEVYGYGFDLETVRAQIENASYGATLEIPLCFIRPSITAEDLAGDLFKDLLGEASTVITGSADLKKNLTQACKELNGLVLKSGDLFSFNDIIGQPSTRNGYRMVEIMVGKKMERVVGGGISQVASTMYIASLYAEFEILERHNHTYLPAYVEPGLDAEISYGIKDFCFSNTTEQPIRMEVVIEGNILTVRFWGTDTRDYTVELLNEIVQTYDPVILEQLMKEDNPDGYKHGDVLVTGIPGYDVITYKIYHPKEVVDPENPEEPEDPENPEDPGEGEEELPPLYEAGQSHYEKRNQVNVSIKAEEPDPTDPTDPTDPVEPSDPTDPVEPTDPTDPTDPTGPITPLDPVIPSIPISPVDPSIPEQPMAP